MKASTLFLGFTLVVLAAALAGLWQAFGPRSAPPTPSAMLPPPSEAPARRPLPPQPTPPEPAESGVRSVYPGARPPLARPPQESPSSAAMAPPSAPEPALRTPLETAPAEERSAALAPPALDAPAEPAPEQAPPTGEGVDLNTAPLEALNTLGAGMIGKTIIANRPYASPDELVTRRILKRQDFETIKARVVVH